MTQRTRRLMPVRPCKGFAAYEVQIGPLVFQWFYRTHKRTGRRGFNLGRLSIWKDQCWPL